MRPAALSSYQERLCFCDGVQRELKPRGDGFLAIAFLVLAIPHRKRNCLDTSRNQLRFIFLFFTG